MMHDEVGAALRNMFRRATLAGDASVDADHVRGTFTGRDGETFTAVPRISDYGFHSEPLAGADALLAAIGGRSDSLHCFGVNDPRYQPSLGPGAVAIFDNNEQIVSLVQRKVRIVSATVHEIVAPGGITVNGVALNVP